MARNPDLEAILQARYELETCDPSQKTEYRAKLDALIKASLAKAGRRDLSPRTFIQITAEALPGIQARSKARRAISSLSIRIVRVNRGRHRREAYR